MIFDIINFFVLFFFAFFSHKTFLVMLVFIHIQISLEKTNQAAKGAQLTMGMNQYIKRGKQICVTVELRLSIFNGLW